MSKISRRLQALRPYSPPRPLTAWRHERFKGSATIVANGHTYEVGQPEVIPMAEATTYFRPREQRMHRQFHVDTALQVRQRLEAHQ